MASLFVLGGESRDRLRSLFVLVPRAGGQLMTGYQRETRTLLLFLFVATATVISSVTPALASTEDPPGTHRDWGFSWHIRAGNVGSDYGEFLEKGTAWDLDIFKQKSNWRYGVGLMFGSLGMQPPHDDQPEWAHFETFGYVSRVFRRDRSIRPYLQGRIGIARSHPRSELFLKEPVDSLESGESPTNAKNGFGVNFIPGLEFQVAHALAIDLSAYFNWYAMATYPLQDYQGNRPLGDQKDPKAGTEWGVRVGATWRPMSTEAPKTAPDTSPLPEGDERRDAWGVTRSFGWAYAEVFGINFGASMFNEYVRQANFNQISPRSFWSNIEDGFNFDDNKFKTNQLVHPFNGSTYYNSGRANGLGFWASTLTALTGAFVWESMGETHPMSYNDVISTGIGGIAFGETTYRLSSAILDNQQRGSGRVWREIGAFLVDPVRGFNRFLSGRATRVQGNPSNPYDWRPPRYFTAFDFGARLVGTGESISDSTETQALIQLYINHGDPFESKRRKPFDHFDTMFHFNSKDKQILTRFQIRADWFSKALGHAEDPQHAIAFDQYFDYFNNNAYEFGGQSLGAAFYSRYRPSTDWGIRTRIDLMGMILGAVNSEFSNEQVVPSQERPREYDYGPGAGASINATAVRKGREILTLSYRGNWLNVTNGSVYNPAGDGTNFSAEHFIQSAGARLRIPIRGPMSFGLDAMVFLRESQYDREDIIDVRQRVPQLHLLLAWDTSR